MRPSLFSSIVFCNLLEICLRMFADRANLRRFLPFANIAAVQALPDDLVALLENFVLLDIRQQQIVPCLMLLLDFGDLLEELRDFLEAFLPRDLREPSCSPAAAALRFAAVSPMPSTSLNQIFACSFSLPAVSSKMREICS